jgi:hypothetical protein
MADVLDGAAGRAEAEELTGVGAAEPQPDGDLVLGGEDVLDVGLKIRSAGSNCTRTICVQSGAL